MTTNFLTKEGFQKLQDELDHLRTIKRQEVAERLHEAMEGGELIENAEYERKARTGGSPGVPSRDRDSQMGPPYSRQQRRSLVPLRVNGRRG